MANRFRRAAIFDDLDEIAKKNKEKKERRQKKSTPTAQKKIKDFIYSYNMLVDSSKAAEASISKEIHDAKDGSKKELVLQEALDYFFDLQIALDKIGNDVEQLRELMSIKQDKVQAGVSARKSGLKGNDKIWLTDNMSVQVRPVGTIKKIFRCWKKTNKQLKTAIIDDPIKYSILQKKNIRPSERYVMNVISLDNYDTLLGGGGQLKPVIKVIEVAPSVYLEMQRRSLEKLGDKDAFTNIDGLSFSIKRTGNGLDTRYEVKNLGENTLNDKEKEYVTNKLFDLDKEFPPVVDEIDLKNQLEIF